MSEEMKNIELNEEQLDGVAGGSGRKNEKGKDYDMVRCPSCGKANEVPAKSGIMVTCCACGKQFEI